MTQSRGWHITHSSNSLSREKWKMVMTDGIPHKIWVLRPPVTACMRLWLSYIRIQMTLAKGGGGFIQIFTHNLLHHFIRIPTHNLPLSHSVLPRQIIRVGLKQITGELDLHKIPLKTSSSVTQTGLLGKICSKEPEPWFGLFVCWGHLSWWPHGTIQLLWIMVIYKITLSITSYCWRHQTL